MSSKVLILNSKEVDNFKAILNLKMGEKSAIKFFNLKQKYKSLALGIKQATNVVKIPLQVQAEKCEFFCEGIDLSKDFTCAVVDISNAFCPEILLSASGSSGIENCNIESAFVQTKPENTSALYVEQTQSEIEDLIDKNLEDDISSTYYDACASCKYREAFYGESNTKTCPKDAPNNVVQNDLKNGNDNKNQSKNKQNGAKSDDFGIKIDHLEANNQKEDTNAEEPSLLESISIKPQNNEESPSSNISTLQSLDANDDKPISTFTTLSSLDEEQNEGKLVEEGKTFYEQISSQIDALFLKYEKESTLQEVVPNSSWTKVTYNGGADYYVLGLVYDICSNVKYICYGMPSNSPDIPPDDMAEFAQWIDSGLDSPKGYWIVCQDAMDGETIKPKLI